MSDRNGTGADLVTLRRIEIDAFQTVSPTCTGARRAVSRLAAWAGVSLLLAIAAPGTAFAPASAHVGGDGARDAVAALEPVTAAIELNPLFENEAIGGELRNIVEQADRGRENAQLRDPDEVLRFRGVAIRRSLVEAILRAAEDTGVDPAYMMALADKESSFAADVKASTSSAEGLFQFVTKTWLNVVREFGPKYGMEAEAESIEVVAGQPVIGDADLREHVLGLRRDPYLSALMAAELLKRDRATIEQRLGRDLTSSEYYLAHFFGADSARRFLELVGQKPKQSATRAFRAAAEANKPLFYSRQGRRMRGLSVSEVYGRIDRMMDTRLDRYRGVASVAATADRPGELASRSF